MVSVLPQRAVIKSKNKNRNNIQMIREQKVEKLLVEGNNIARRQLKIKIKLANKHMNSLAKRRVEKNERNGQ